MRVLCLLILSLSGWVSAAEESRLKRQFRFKEPGFRDYELVERERSGSQNIDGPWLKARSRQHRDLEIEFSNRLAVQTRPGITPQQVVTNSRFRLARQLAPGFAIFEGPGARETLLLADELSRNPLVHAAFPVARRQKKLQGSYAALPNDPYYRFQWYLEHRNQDGQPAGVDLNVRSAWAQTRGEGVVMAIGDDGVEWTHPELEPGSIGMPHINWSTGSTNAMAVTSSERHGTAVAGLAVAKGENGRGMSGVAPNAGFASWKLFTGSQFSATDEQMMDMFQFASNTVAIQNHSWAYGGLEQLGPSLLEHLGIANAITHGRGGKGVIIVRAAGNEREGGGNVNDDGYPADPRTIAVAAVRFDGRVASYSNPGACVLVGAPSGDDQFPTLFTTDRQGSAGYNVLSYTNDFADYGFDSSGFQGTSGSAPLVAGVAALMLSVRPELSYRDVQQLLLLSSRHFDFADPGLSTNGAGLQASHNVGFGVPDAGHAVNLARTWPTRPALLSNVVNSTTVTPIPNDGLRVVIENAPAGLEFIPASPSLGIHPDSPTASVTLADVGLATNAITSDLRGKGALIQRGGGFFVDKIQRAADAGALFAIVYNNSGTFERVDMGQTDFTPIPAVFIGKTHGDQLRDTLMLTNLQASLQLTGATYSFEMLDSLSCEHVAVRVQTDHPRRRDVRITLLSPRGTRSVLQKVNDDDFPGPIDWTYYSVHNFYENSRGTWTVVVSDENGTPLVEGGDSVGQVLGVELCVYGTSLVDADQDGLSDKWEVANFSNLSASPSADRDGDGYSNLKEFLMGTNPRMPNSALQLDLSLWSTNYGRVSWTGSTNYSYQLAAGANVNFLTVLTNLPGSFPETEFFFPRSSSNRFFRVIQQPR